jgi:MHS family alpha-ketoglutarate permease-like MFS transporter
MSNQTTTHRIWSIIGGSLGNLVEWYDWYVYSAFRYTLPAFFFPAGNNQVQLL